MSVPAMYGSLATSALEGPEVHTLVAHHCCHLEMAAERFEVATQGREPVVEAPLHPGELRLREASRLRHLDLRLAETPPELPEIHLDNLLQRLRLDLLDLLAAQTATLNILPPMDGHGSFLLLPKCGAARICCQWNMTS